jgi:hypothetical protein
VVVYNGFEHCHNGQAWQLLSETTKGKLTNASLTDSWGSRLCRLVLESLTLVGESSDVLGWHMVSVLTTAKDAPPPLSVSWLIVFRSHLRPQKNQFSRCPAGASEHLGAKLIAVEYLGEFKFFEVFVSGNRNIAQRFRQECNGAWMSSSK